jgi:phosphoserine phosphatase
MNQKTIKKIRSLMKRHGTNQAHVFDLDGTIVNANILTLIVRSLIYELYPTPSERLAFVKSLTRDAPNSVIKNGTIIWDYTCIDSADAVHLIESDLLIDRPVIEVCNHLSSLRMGIMQRTYRFPLAVIDALHKRKPRPLIICITGTPQEIAENIYKKLGFDVVVGCEYPKKNGRYIQGVKMLDSGLNKGKIMDQLQAHCAIVWTNCIAFGDNKYDVDMFDRSTFPVAMNPKTNLQNIVRTKINPRWKAQRIAWADQRIGESANECRIWVANADHKLQEVSFNDILPNDIAIALEQHPQGETNQ